MNPTNRATRQPETRIRAPRVKVDENLVVETRTIGTDISFRLCTENISKSGLLLRGDLRSKIPFIVNTIVEMVIDPRGVCLRAPLSCLGKIVRREESEDNGPEGAVRNAMFGVQIVQIDQNDMNQWENCLNRLEKVSGLVRDNDAIMIPPPPLKAAG